MSGKKKTQKQKMSLSDFLADESSGSWADEMSDLPSAPSVSREESGRFDDLPRGPARNNVDRFDDLPRGPARNNGDRFGDRGDRHEREGGFREREGGFREREGGFRERERSFPPRAPVALPTEPPFTAHIGNLSFDVNDDDVANFFSGMKIAQIRILRDRDSDRHKGYGYIEFEDLESLKAALELNGESLQNRAVRVNPAEPPKERQERPERQDRTNVGSWRREGPVSLPERERPEREGRFRERQERPERTFADRRSDTSWSGGAFSRDNNFRRGDRAPPAERPRLNLLPRTVGGGNKADDGAKPAKASPFGNAKPVDTNKVLERVEDKIQHLKVDDDKKEE